MHESIAISVDRISVILATSTISFAFYILCILRTIRFIHIFIRSQLMVFVGITHARHQGRWEWVRLLSYAYISILCSFLGSICIFLVCALSGYDYSIVLILYLYLAVNLIHSHFMSSSQFPLISNYLLVLHIEIGLIFY